MTNIWLIQKNFQYSGRQLKVILKEMEESMAAKGYTALWSSLKVSYQENIRRDVVMKLLRELDLNGSENRKAYVLRRRRYISMDRIFVGTPTGMTNWSRAVYLYKIVMMAFRLKYACFYIETLKKMRFWPQYLRKDCATENGIIAGIQCLFGVSEDSHRYGTSVSSQRIGNWWSHMRKGFTNWLIEFLKDLVNEHLFIPGNQTHLECIWFAFSSLLETELD